MAAINDVLSTIKRFGREEIESSTPAKNGPSIQANCPEVASKALTRTNRFFGNNMGIKELKAGWNRALKQLLKKASPPTNNIFLYPNHREKGINKTVNACPALAIIINHSRFILSAMTPA